MDVRVEITERLDDEQVAAVLALVEAAAEADGVGPLNEHVMLQVRYGAEPGARAVLLYEDGTAYATEIETGLLRGETLHVDRFRNRFAR